MFHSVVIPCMNFASPNLNLSKGLISQSKWTHLQSSMGPLRSYGKLPAITTENCHRRRQRYKGHYTIGSVAFSHLRQGQTIILHWTKFLKIIHNHFWEGKQYFFPNTFLYFAFYLSGFCPFVWLDVLFKWWMHILCLLGTLWAGGMVVGMLICLLSFISIMSVHKITILL